MKPRRPERGFTLLEMLVALVILGFIVTGLAGGSWLGEKASNARARDEAAYQDLQPVDQVLRRLVAGITRPNDPQMPGLIGHRTSLICITSDPLPAAGDTPTRVEASLKIGTGHNLLLRWSPHVHANRLLTPPAPREDDLIDGVERIEFSYLSPDRSSWLSGWNRTDLPVLVRMQLVFVAGDPRRWPPIIVALREGVS